MIVETIILSIVNAHLLDNSKFAIGKIKEWDKNKESYNKNLILETLIEYKLEPKDIDELIKRLEKDIKITTSDLHATVIAKELTEFLNIEFPDKKLSGKDFYYSLLKKIHTSLLLDDYFKSFVINNLSIISTKVLYLSKYRNEVKTSDFDIYILLKTLHSISDDIKLNPGKLSADHKELLEVMVEFAKKIYNQYQSLEILNKKQNQIQMNFFDEVSINVQKIYPNIEKKSKTLELYNKQVLIRYGKLEFLGMPDFKEKPKMDLEKIFVPIRSAGIESSDIILYELYNNKRKIVVLGDPGSGKTTLAKYITITHANLKAPEVLNTENLIPILITLRHFANALIEKGPGYSISQYILDHIKEDMNVKLDSKLLQYYLSIGDCIILFDGLDELPNVELRFKVKKIVESFSISYPLNFYCVTSRIVGYSESSLDSEEFDHFTIRPLSLEEIKKFVKSWYEIREQSPRERAEMIKSLINAIETNEGVKRLSSNPLMLTIIALVHRIEAELPNERVKLYDKCTEALISTWEKYKGTYINIGDTIKRRRLEKLAFKMHNLTKNPNEQVELKAEKLKTMLKGILLESGTLVEEQAEEEADVFIEYIRKRIGILIERGQGIYGFIHLTFEEYFAACDIEKRYINNLDNMWGVIEPMIIDSRWNEVMLLLMGKLGDFDEPVNDIIHRIIRKNDPTYNTFILNVLRDNVNMSKKTKIDCMNYIIDYALQDFDIKKFSRVIQDVRGIELIQPLIDINRLSYFQEFVSILVSKIKDKRDFLNFFRHMIFVNNISEFGNIALLLTHFKPSDEFSTLLVKFKHMNIASCDLSKQGIKKFLEEPILQIQIG